MILRVVEVEIVNAGVKLLLLV